jgi:hypothetical protein
MCRLKSTGEVATDNGCDVVYSNNLRRLERMIDVNRNVVRTAGLRAETESWNSGIQIRIDLAE